MYPTIDAEEHLVKQMETSNSKQKHSYTYMKLGQLPLMISQQRWCTEPTYNYQETLPESYSAAEQQITHAEVCADSCSVFCVCVLCVLSVSMHKRQSGLMGLTFMGYRETPL